MKKRLVIKVGSNTLTTDNGLLNEKVMKELVQQIATLKAQGWDCVLVSSGAVSAGRGLLQDPTSSPFGNKQLLAAVGQVTLLSTYAELLKKHALLCAQILVTKEDFRDRNHYFNLRSCFESLLHDGIVPIVNENDVIAVTELLFTDNDELAGLVASMLGAERLIILTNVEGIYDGNPSLKSSKVIPAVTDSNFATVVNYVAPVKSSFGRGGMVTKLRMARKLARQGITTHIAPGTVPTIILDCLADKPIGTRFESSRRSSNLKRRIANTEGFEKGSVFINDCAIPILTASEKAASLLPVGITKVEGDFEKGDVIEVRSEANQKIGFGQARYSAEKARELMGQKQAPALIHYDYLFIV